MKIEKEYNNGRLSDLSYVTFIKYYPVKFSVSDDYKRNRGIVYDFKDGILNAEVDSLFKSEIITIFNKYSEKFYAVPIPASTKERNDKRYQHFLRRITPYVNICENGFDLIKPVTDRQEIHKSNQRDYSQIINCLQFSNVQGKNILLIDDVVTRAKSFNIVASHLKSKGAKRVIGLMLAKTHWLDEESALVSGLDDLPF